MLRDTERNFIIESRPWADDCDVGIGVEASEDATGGDLLNSMVSLLLV